MLNRSAVVIGHEPAFYGWLKTTGVGDRAIEERKAIAERTVYLVASCHFPEEVDEVVEDVFADIFERELKAWQPDESHWPDTDDFELFSRWFTVDGVACVQDVGHGVVAEEA